jgi:hypothetical protein
MGARGDAGMPSLIAMPAAPGTNAMGHRRTRELVKACCAAVITERRTSGGAERRVFRCMLLGSHGPPVLFFLYGIIITLITRPIYTEPFFSSGLS